MNVEPQWDGRGCQRGPEWKSGAAEIEQIGIGVETASVESVANRHRTTEHRRAKVAAQGEIRVDLGAEPFRVVEAHPFTGRGETQLVGHEAGDRNAPTEYDRATTQRRLDMSTESRPASNDTVPLMSSSERGIGK